MGEAETRELLGAFVAAWNDHDLDAALALTTDDVIFESTGPPDGERAKGRDAVRVAWNPIFAAATSRFDEEELIVAGNRAVQRWTYHWDGGFVRGVDVFKIRDGKIAEKLSYVKG